MLTSSRRMMSGACNSAHQRLDSSAKLRIHVAVIPRESIAARSSSALYGFSEGPECPRLQFSNKRVVWRLHKVAPEQLVSTLLLVCAEPLIVSVPANAGTTRWALFTCWPSRHVSSHDWSTHAHGAHVSHHLVRFTDMISAPKMSAFYRSNGM